MYTLNNIPENITKINKLTTEQEIYFNKYLKFNKLKSEYIFHNTFIITPPLNHLQIRNNKIYIGIHIYLYKLISLCLHSNQYIDVLITA